MRTEMTRIFEKCLLSIQEGTILPVVLIFLLNALMYAPTVNYPLLWDDDSLIQKSNGLSGFDKLDDAFTGHYLAAISDRQTHLPYYRPVSLSVLVIQKTLFGDNRAGYRLINFFTHLLSAILLFLTSRWFLRERLRIVPGTTGVPALFASMLFCSLPYNMDAVMFITDLGDLMVLSALLLALVACEQFLEKGRILSLAYLFLCSLVALGSKETGIVVAPLLLLWALLRARPINRRRLIAALTLPALCTVAYMIGRSLFLADTTQLSLKTAIFRYPGDILVALRWALLPHPVSLMEAAPASMLATSWWIGVLLLLLLAVLIFRLVRRQPGICFLILTFFLVVTPSVLPPRWATCFLPDTSMSPALPLPCWRPADMLPPAAHSGRSCG